MSSLLNALTMCSYRVCRTANFAQSAASGSQNLKCCTFPLHKKGGHMMNEWLAHLCNSQLKSQHL